MGGVTVWTTRFMQSEEDGSMPLCTACFSGKGGIEIESGGFYEPTLAGAMKGPVGRAKKNKIEFLGLDMLWKMSEEAIGEKWDVF